MSDKTVTIELPSGALAGWPVLLDALRQAKEKTGYLLIFGDLIAQIERQTTPPKPEEPTGLGAVVEGIYAKQDATSEPDRRRFQFVHIGAGKWQQAGNGFSYDWDEIAVVRVLSEGVTA